MEEISYFKTLSERPRGLWYSARWPLAIAVVLVAVLGAYWSNRAEAVNLNLRDGVAISATGTSDTGVYIIKDAGYKRWVINPNAIFPMYGHLSLSNVVTVTAAERDNFRNSGLFRNCETNAQPVYALEINGTAGILHWVNISGATAVSQDPEFFLKVFCINNREMGYYTIGSDYTSVSQIPSYSAGIFPTPIASPTVTPTPSPTVSPTPTPTASPTASPTPTPTVSGNLNVTLASTTPASGNVARGTDRAAILRFNVTNSSSSPMQITRLVVLESGTSIQSDIEAVYLYQGANQVSGSVGLSSNNTATFDNLNITIPANSSVELSILVDVSPNAVLGNSIYFQVQNLVASGFSASGTVVSNQMFVAQ